LTIAGVAYASIPDSGGVFHGCVNKTTGVLRVIDTSKSGTLGHCITSGSQAETAIKWNQTGPQGPQGVTGATGATGATGPQGPSGDGVVSGYDYVNSGATVPAGQGMRVEATCASGKVPVGGGFVIGGDSAPPPVEVSYSRPFQSFNTGSYSRGWAVFFYNPDSVEHNVTVSASCVPLSGDTTVISS
jgi:hypothetical protein